VTAGLAIPARAADEATPHWSILVDIHHYSCFKNGQSWFQPLSVLQWQSSSSLQAEHSSNLTVSSPAILALMF
jgi:hypothetical protein